jgi:hypothetical protein
MSNNHRGGRLIEILVILLAVVTLVATVALPETRAFLGLDGGAASEESGAEPPGSPADEPGSAPTDEPGSAPTDEPGSAPTDEPGSAPTDEPGSAPTDEPGSAPTDEPGSAPTDEPGSADEPDDLGSGMLINAIEPGSPADAAGFPIDGWLLSLAGESIKNSGTVRSIATQNRGVPITAVIRYNGEIMELEVTPASEEPIFGVELCKPALAERCRERR